MKKLTVGKLIEILKKYPEDTKIIGYCQRDDNNSENLIVEELSCPTESKKLISIDLPPQDNFPYKIENDFGDKCLIFKKLFN